MAKKAQHIPIAIVGSGFAGLGMSIRLKQAGIEDFVVFERADDIGGTWRDNTYPGCACDVESTLYSFSFAPNPKWSRMWSPQPEILEYLRGCVKRFKLQKHIKLGHNLDKAKWDDARQVWRLTVAGEPWTCEVLISAMGALTEPQFPNIPGLKKFEGKAFHSARWDDKVQLAKRRVAVIGTGASAIQIIPEIQPKVARLFVFQRTPPWVLPFRNRRLGTWEHILFAKLPLAQKLSRLRIYLYREYLGLSFRHPYFQRHLETYARRYLAHKVPDPALREKVTPNFRIGCKRILLSSRYYPALQSDNVEVVTDAVREIRAHSLVTDDGVERKVDAIVFATGFRLTEMHNCHQVFGKKGKRLSDHWQGSPRAHLGTTVNGFPNLFFIFGPNTALGHSSVLLMAEGQMNHILKAIEWMRRHGKSTLEPREEKQQAFNAIVDRKMESTVWKSGCHSWYLDETGRNSTLWPSSVGAFRRKLDTFRSSDYEFQEASPIG